MIEGTGIVAAHLYDFLTRIYPTFGGGRNYVQTPTFVKRWFGAQNRRQTQRAYGTAYRAGDRTPQSSATGTSWYQGLGGNWRGRGSGRRLGGD